MKPIPNRIAEMSNRKFRPNQKMNPHFRRFSEHRCPGGAAIRTGPYFEGERFARFGGVTLRGRLSRIAPVWRFVRGVVMSSTAKTHKRKDGTGVFVIARHELALQPGLAVWEAFHDPKDGKVKLDGENVVAFPKLPEFQQITLKVLRWEERDKRLVIKDAEMVA